MLGHQRSGFLWTAIQDAGNTARNFGEFMYASRASRPGDVAAVLLRGQDASRTAVTRHS